MTEQNGSGAAVGNPARAFSEVAQNQQAFFDSSNGITRVLGFHPVVPHPCSLVKGVFEPSDRGSLSQHRHQQTNRVAPVQPLLGCNFSQDRRTWFVHRETVQVCDSALDGLFQFVSLWGGVRPPLLFSRVSLFCFLCSTFHSPRCRRLCSLCSVGLLESVKEIS